MSKRPARAAIGAGAAVLFCAAVAALLVRRYPGPGGPAPAAIRSGKAARIFAAELEALRARENQMTDTVWQKELLAERQGQVFEELWDALNAATNKLALAASVPLRELIPPVLSERRNLAQGIVQYSPGGPGPAWGSSQWRLFLADRQAQGWELAQVEFLHNQFELDQANRPKQSRFFFTAHLANARRPERAIATMDQRGQLAAIEAPTLVLAGRDDPVTPPATAFHLHEAIARSALSVVPGAAHLPNIEQADRVNAVLLDHLLRP